MKKTLLTITLVAVSLFTFAQVPTVGIKGGVNFASLSTSFSGSSSSISSGTLTSFSAGVFVDFKTPGALSVQPALLYTGKGATESSGDVKADVKINYLQVPVNFVYNIPAVVGTFYIGAGPYAAYGLSAKLKASGGGNSISQDIEFGDEEGTYKRFDFGATALAGLKFKKGLLLNLNYDLGLSNISNESDTSTKTRVFGISVGYAF